MAKTLLEVQAESKRVVNFKFQPELPEIILYQIQDIFAMTLVT